MTTETQAASDDERKEIEIKNILVPIDGSEYSVHAAQYATRIARNEKAQLFCIHAVTPQRFKFFHRHTSSPSPSSDYTKQESPEERHLISYESLPVYDSESNEFVGEVEIPVELQLISQEMHSRMANIIENKVEAWFDIVRNMAKDEGIPDIEIWFEFLFIIHLSQKRSSVLVNTFFIVAVGFFFIP